MATINQHRAKDGSITFRVRVQHRGQRTQTATFPTLRDARKWATMIEGQMIEGRHFPVKSPRTLAELLDKYSTDIMPRKTAETQRSQKYVIAYWRRTLGHMFLDDIQPQHIIAARNEIAQTGKAATVTKYLVTLSHAFTTAIKEYQWCELNPCSRVSRPKQPPGRVRFLSDEERARLLQECRKSHNPHIYALVTCALHTGLRRGSLFQMTTQNTNTEQGTITLERTKNGSRLVLPLMGEALTIARTLKETSRDGYVFPRGTGDPWNHYRRAWDYAVARAEVVDCTFHDLRHCVGSYLIQMGVPLFVISQILAHSSVTTTQRYAHLHVDNLRDALKTLSQRLSS
jgi:integrase